MEISGMMLQVKAAEFNKALGGPETFTASNGWLEKFLHRHGIRTLTVCGEKQEADFKGAEEYVHYIAMLIKDENLAPEQIYNADQRLMKPVWSLERVLLSPKLCQEKHFQPGAKCPRIE